MDQCTRAPSPVSTPEQRDPIGVKVAFGETPPQPTAEVVTIDAPDLGDLSRQVKRVREDRPGAIVLVDIHVAIAHQAAEARSTLAATNVTVPTNTLVYVGTPHGLASLLDDIHALGLADGATIRPLLPALDLELIQTRAPIQLWG